MLSDEQARRLLRRYRQGQCSPGEEAAVEQWYRQLQDKSAWDFEPGEEALTGARIKARVDANLGLDEQGGRRLRRRKQWYLAAAAVAALVLLLAGGYRIFFQQKAVPVLAGRQQPDDVAPGGNRAVLTLANGQKIVLDSARTGQLARQGSSNIVKVNSGLLAYQASASTGSATAASTGSVTATSTGSVTAASTPAPGNFGVEGAIQYNTLATPRGGQYQLILPDGTKVWLNAASSIRYPTAFRGKERKVEITGEAYFEVTKDAARPFVAAKGSTKVEVLGTRFDINAYEGEPVLKVTLLEGSVRVSRPETGIPRMLLPGQQAELNKAGQLKVIKDVNTAQAVAWKNGRIDFTNADVKSVMRQISRWYDVDIVYKGAVPEKRFFGRVSRNVYLSTILDFLRQNGVHVRQEGRKVIVLP